MGIATRTSSKDTQTARGEKLLLYLDLERAAQACVH